MARILVIDDDIQIRGMIAFVLSAQQHEVIEASDGRAAIRSHQEQPAELVITDMVMPDMDGLEIAREFRRIAPAVPLIAMSGSAHSEVYLDIARFLGARNILTKPFSLVQLVALVEELLAVSRA